MASRATCSRPRLRDHHATVVTPGKPGDASVASDLIADLLVDETPSSRTPPSTRRRRRRCRHRGTRRRHDCLRRQCLWDRETAGTPRPSRHHLALQDPASDCPRRVVQQGPLCHRSRQGTSPAAGVTVQIRVTSWPTSAAPALTAHCGAVHYFSSGRTIRISPYEEALSRARSRQAETPGATTTAPPTEGRAQDRSSRLPQTRRTASPRARHDQGRRRLPPPRRCRQSRPSRTPRSRMDRSRWAIE